MSNDITPTNAVDISDAEKYKERLNIALKAAKICVFEVDLVNQLYNFFENSEDIFGISGEKILEDVRPFSNLSPDAYQRAVSDYFSHPDDTEVIDRAFQSIFKGQSTTYQARMRAGGSNFIWCKLDVSPVMQNNIPVRMIGVITDISDLKTKTDTLENAVKIDGFTGLYDKTHAIDLIQQALRQKPDQTHAFILVDIDNFKKCNDLNGHAVGDRIIKLLADTLKSSFRKTDIIGRFGGDEFILLVQDIPNMEWLMEKLQGLVRCDDGGYGCTNSIGISIFPQDSSDFNLLFQKADKALYQSKLIHESYTFFSGNNP